MNRAVLPSEMLHCADMTVLERQKSAHMKWQQQQQGCYGNMAMSGGGFHGFEDGCLGEVVTRSAVKPELGMAVEDIHSSSNNGWCDLVSFGGGTSSVGFMSNNGGGSNNAGCGFGLNFGRTSSCPLGAMEIVRMNSKARDHPLQQRQNQSVLADTVITTSGDVGRESFKKRKLDKVLTHNTKVVAEEEEEGREKKIKVCAEDGESKITEKQNANKSSSSNSNKKENSSDTSKENSKVTEVQKPDYIHVRARRGQATDSHSLAERVRREKISERMKYLQDLVPGCNKITGKAGMLDEIINYVQSLQRQVEFLSMKLAAVNPSLDFNIDNLFAKEAFSACATNFPTIGMSSDMTNPDYHQFNPLQQQLVTCGLDMGVNPPDMAQRRTISAPVTLPDTFLDSSFFTEMQAPSSTWDADLQNLYNVAFDQARPTSYPSQQFTGSIEACNMKMEM